MCGTGALFVRFIDGERTKTRRRRVARTIGLAVGRPWPPFLLTILTLMPSPALADAAQIRETILEIPTYVLGAEDKNPPLWNEKVYPYAMQTEITRQTEVRPYRAVVLENAFLQVLVLPDLGGKIYAAHDKTNGNCDFIYRNHVIKPGLVALRGAWTSGGIEWNFPTRGHSVNTFSPVNYTTRRNPDGSVTRVDGATEWVRRMQWSVAITLPADRCYFHNRMLLFNPTLGHQRAYFWANAAVHAWPDTRVTFPPAECTFAGMRRTPEPWPWNQGRDVSWYASTPFPHDFFCGTPGDFQGAYHAQRDHGTVHCAAWQESYGRKFWTWGTAPSGQIWEGILTDRDGPYIEVQSGRLQTQGDTWLFEPHMQESFEEYWYPVKQLGTLVKATRDVALGITCRGGRLRVAVNATGDFPGASVEVTAGGRRMAFEPVELRVAGVWAQDLEGVKPDAAVQRVVIRDRQGRELLVYETPGKKPLAPELEPEFTAAADLASAEDLYFRGYYAWKHWNQREAAGLFEKALERDADFTPALRALAMMAYQAGRYEAARDYGHRVLRRNDDDETARYYRALAMLALGEAGDAAGPPDRPTMDLHSLGRRAGYRHIAPYVLATQSAASGDLARTEGLLREAIEHNPHDLKARTLLAAVLRQRGQPTEAMPLVRGVLAEHPLDRLALVEQVLLGGTDELQILQDDVQAYVETACDYLEMGLRGDAAAVLRCYQGRSKASVQPMVEFYLGYLADLDGQAEQARQHFAAGARLPIRGVFPFRNEDATVLCAALRYLPDEWRLHSLLGTWYAARQQPHAAREHLTKAVQAVPDDPTVYRNLGEVYWHEFNDLAQAQAVYEKARQLDPLDASYYVALDRIDAALGQSTRRAERFEAAPEAVRRHHQVLLREATCLVDAGQFDQALEILRTNTFHVWEGKAEGQELFIRALNARADRHMAAGQYEKAVADLHEAQEYPENLGAGRPHAPNYVREYYKLGLCYRALNQPDRARDFFQKAADSPVDLLREDPEIRRKAQEEVKAGEGKR